MSVLSIGSRPIEHTPSRLEGVLQKIIQTIYRFFQSIADQIFKWANPVSISPKPQIKEKDEIDSIANSYLHCLEVNFNSMPEKSDDYLLKIERFSCLFITTTTDPYQRLALKVIRAYLLTKSSCPNFLKGYEAPLNSLKRIYQSLPAVSKPQILMTGFDLFCAQQTEIYPKLIKLITAQDPAIAKLFNRFFKEDEPEGRYSFIHVERFSLEEKD